MQRMNSIGLRGTISCCGALSALAWLTLFLAVTPAAAVPANFDSTGVGFIPSADLMALPSGTIDINVPLLTAGDPSGGGSFEIDFTGSSGGDVCILAASQPGICQADLTNVTSGFSAIVTLEISALNTTQIAGPFTLVLSMLDPGNSGAGGPWQPGQVSIALDPTTGPMPTDVSAVPGFNFDGSFDSLVRIEDQACTNSGGNCNYLGWTVSGIGDTATFRFDTSVAPSGRNTPKLLFNAVPVVVPEPGTALLIGLGLAGLSSAGRRAGRRHS